MIRQLWELKSRQAALRTVIAQGRSDREGLILKVDDALHDLEDVLAQIFPENEWSGRELRAVALVTKAFHEDPTNIGSLVLRLATLGEGLRDAMDHKQRNTQWFRDAKAEYNELGGALQEIKWNLAWPWPFMSDGSKAAKYPRVAPSLVKLCNRLLRPWDNMMDVLVKEHANEDALVDLKRAMQKILSKMDDPRLGLVPTRLEETYKLPTAFCHMGAASYQQMEAPPE